MMAGHSARSSPLRKGLLLPLAFFVATLAVRAPVLRAHLDTWYPFEVHAGSIAVALRAGLDVKWSSLPIVSHIRGSVLNALLLVPLYAVFGASTLVMKLVPLVWQALTVALLVHVLARYASRFAAVATGVLLVLAPPVVQKLSVLGLSSHQESSLFCVLALWAWLRLTQERRFGAGPAFAFGLVAGFAGFYHVQALLPCALLLGLLLVMDLPALFPRGLLELLLGLMLGLLPSFLFEGGSLRVVTSIFTGDVSGSPEEEAAGATAPPLVKLGKLASTDFAESLEYGEVPGETGRVLATIETSALAGLTLLGAWLERRRMRALFARILRRAPPEPIGPQPPLLLYALGLLASYALSHAFLRPGTGSGATNRYLAPLWFALLVLSGLALGSLAAAGRRRLATGLLVLAVTPSAIAWPAVAHATPAATLPQRGECLEWFRAQLLPVVGGADGQAMMDLVRRIDRGDPAFRTLRFRVSMPRLTPEQPDLLEQEQRLRLHLDPVMALVSLTSLGRLVGSQFQATTHDDTQRAALGENAHVWLRDPAFWELAGSLGPAPSAALLHGVGLSLSPPRLGIDPNRADAFMQQLDHFFLALPPRFARTVAEGYGFVIGSTYEPYNGSLNTIVTLQDRLDDSVGDSIYLGMGWGARQRYLVPPAEVPEGLKLLQAVPERRRAAFTDGFTGKVLPPEAAIARS